MAQGSFFTTVTQNPLKESVLNSSTNTLTAGSTFTGEWEDVLQYEGITIAVKTDQNGTFQIQFSPDGVNIDSTLTRYYRTSEINPPHTFFKTRRYCRVVFTNTSSSNQTYFRLQTIFGPYDRLNAPTDSVLAQDYDASVVRPTNYNYVAALGLRKGTTMWNKWGYNNDIDIGTETVWSYGGTFSKLNSASTIRLVSSSSNDTKAGTGAQSVVVYGVDGNWQTVIEVVSLSGTSTATTSNTFLGINRIAVYSGGTTNYNEGNITAYASSNNSVQGYIPLGIGVTQQAFFFIQADHQCLLDWLYFNFTKVTGGGGSPVVTVKIFVTSILVHARYEVFRYTIDTSVENSLEVDMPHPILIGEKSFVEVQATTDTNNTVASVRMSYLEIKDADASF